ncbi:hypothetical protein BDV97DRAFT_406843 [Delphinella strobiligena]|nr:hypothetical protein BDV97DRAFT_406843 [Delphinella strobiligena]
MACDETNKDTTTAKASTLSTTPDDLPPINTLSITADDETNRNTITAKAQTVPTTPDVLPPVTAYDHTIQVLVGDPPRATFELHRGLLTFYSSYFAAALSPRWHPPPQRTLTLDEDPHLFSIFHTWLYTHRLPATISPLPILSAIQIWTFAEYYGIPSLQNLAMNSLLSTLISIWRTFTSPEIGAVYAFAPPQLRAA